MEEVDVATDGFRFREECLIHIVHGSEVFRLDQEDVYLVDEC
jgi:hypothetical protein